MTEQKIKLIKEERLCPICQQGALVRTSQPARKKSQPLQIGPNERVIYFRCNNPKCGELTKKNIIYRGIPDTQ